MSYDKYYSTTELTKILGITKQAIHYRIRKGQIKFIKPGRDYLFPKKQFEYTEAFQNQFKDSLDILDKLTIRR